MTVIWQLAVCEFYKDNCKKTYSYFKRQCKGQTYKTAEIILLCHKMRSLFCTFSTVSEVTTLWRDRNVCVIIIIITEPFTCELIAKRHSLSCYHKCDLQKLVSFVMTAQTISFNAIFDHACKCSQRSKH